jgi:hypothetical protein
MAMYDPVTHFHSITCRYCHETFRTRFGRKRYCTDQCYIKAHPPKYHRWTHQETRLLRELAGKVSVTEIAERLGRTINATKYKAHQLKVNLILYGERHPGTKQSDALVEQARILYDEGLMPKAIALRLGIPYSTAKYFVEYRVRLGPPIEYYF